MNLEQALRNGLDKIRSGQLTNEAQVKQAVILPILRELGWDDTNPNEFVPELAVEVGKRRGSVDYALCRTTPNWQPLVFIETKRLGNADTVGEEQLFEYATNKGVPLLVLTDGDVWNFYLAMAAGSPPERVVYRAELRQEEKLAEYAGFFQRYLEKARVLSEKARQDAETKRLGNADTVGEEQLFEYATNKGVPLLVLTDGDVWNFYLAMAAGSPPERVVYRAELRQEEKLAEYAGFFQRYLEKARVLSEKARQDAEKDKESEGNRLTARNAIPNCWQSLLGEPDDFLVELLVEAVEKNCGIRPEHEDVKAFLKSQRSATPQVTTIKSETSGESIETEPTIQTIDSTRIKITGFVIDGHRRICGSGGKTIAEILIEFQKRGHTFMTRFAPKTIGRNRCLVAQNPDDIYDNPNLQGKVRDLENGWWMATNIGTKTIRQSIKLACEVAGVEFGTQLTLIER